MSLNFGISRLIAIRKVDAERSWIKGEWAPPLTYLCNLDEEQDNGNRFDREFTPKHP